MKKAKIFLTALTVLAVAAGVVAFKAKAPQVFGQCDLNTKKCTLNQIITPRNTTLTGPEIFPYDLTSKDCKQVGSIFTCETFTTLE
jgi:hypothetical protein